MSGEGRLGVRGGRGWSGSGGLGIDVEFRSEVVWNVIPFGLCLPCKPRPHLHPVCVHGSKVEVGIG